MKKVLFVEDNEESRLIFRRLVEREGFLVMLAANGEDALRLIQAEPPDLIVSDIMMPRLDGFGLCRAVKSDPRLAGIPFLFYTATYLSPADEQLGYRLGASRYLIKPLEPAELIRNLREILETGKTAGSLPDAAATDHLQIDILSRKLESKTRDLEFYREIFVLNHDAIAVTDLAGRLVARNEAYGRLFAAGEKDTSGSLVDHLGEGPIRSVLAELASGQRFTGELACRLRSGQAVNLETSAFSIREEHGDPVRHVFIFRDVTHRKNAEVEKEILHAQFLQAQKMESIGRLAGGVAHDFNNLLTTILGYAQLGMMSIDGETPIREYLQIISDSAEKAANLTRQLLAFSRKQRLEIGVVNLNEVVKNMAKLLRSLVGEDVVILLNTQSPVQNIEADISQIEQILMNLAVNARDAMPRGGKLMIETADVFMDFDPSGRHGDMEPGDYVMLAVSDTGCGIPPEVREKIFEPFFTTKAAGKGTGLGLSTVHGIVTQHGGHIYVYSEPGLGTTLKCYFKASGRSGGLEAERGGPDGMSRGSETLLVVDDESFIRRLLVDVLESLGYRVLSAANGEEALEAVGAFDGAIDLLITDIVMPGMNGKELADTLRRSGRVSRVILTSGYPDAVLQNYELSEADQVFLQKPLSPFRLADTVRRVLDGRLPAAPVARLN